MGTEPWEEVQIAIVRPESVWFSADMKRSRFEGRWGDIPRTVRDPQKDHWTAETLCYGGGSRARQGSFVHRKVPATLACME